MTKKSSKQFLDSEYTKGYIKICTKAQKLLLHKDFEKKIAQINAYNVFSKGKIYR